MTGCIFANCAVLDGSRNQRREDHHVRIENGRIREVSDRRIASAAAETIDLGGRTLMPGLRRIAPRPPLMRVDWEPAQWRRKM